MTNEDFETIRNQAWQKWLREMGGFVTPEQEAAYEDAEMDALMRNDLNFWIPKPEGMYDIR